MISDGVITYGYLRGDFLSWRFSNDVLNEIVIAALLTVLSYQLAETVINLCFGIKRRGEATLRDLQVILLIRKFSPLTVLRNLLSGVRLRNPFSQQRNRARTREDEADEEDELAGPTDPTSKWFILSYWKLIFLLLAIPLINVGTVVLSLERDTEITFADSNFGGLAFGLDLNLSITDWSPVSRTPTITCNSTELHTNAAEFPIAEFYACIFDLTRTSPVPTSRRGLVLVQVSRSKAERINIQVQITGGRADLVKRTILLTRSGNSSIEGTPTPVAEPPSLGLEEDLDVQQTTGRHVYYLLNNLTEEDADRLLSEGMKLASAFCDSTEDEQEDIEKGNGGAFDKVRFARCVRASERSPEEDRKSANEVAHELLDRLSFVDSDTLQVLNADDENQDNIINENFVSGEDLLLLRRRRGFVSIPLMVVLAAGSMVLRILSELVTRNDLERGIGLIVRDGLGLPCCDSMLCSFDVVARYNRRGNVLYEIERQPGGSRGRKETDDAL